MAKSVGDGCQLFRLPIDWRPTIIRCNFTRQESPARRSLETTRESFPPVKVHSCGDSHPVEELEYFPRVNPISLHHFPRLLGIGIESAGVAVFLEHILHLAIDIIGGRDKAVQCRDRRSITVDLPKGAFTTRLFRALPLETMHFR